MSKKYKYHFISKAVVLLSLFIGGCQTTGGKQSVSIEEAEAQLIELEQLPQITASARELEGLGDLPYSLDDVSDYPACVVPSRKLTINSVNTIAENMDTSDGFARHQLMQYEAQEEMRTGQISNALLLQRKAISTVPSSWTEDKGVQQLYMSIVLSKAGEYLDARRFYNNGIGRLSRSQSSNVSCRFRDKYSRYRGKGAIELASGNMAEAALSFENAYRTLDELRDYSGVCEVGGRTLFSEMRLSQAEALLWKGDLVAAETRAREAYALSRKVRPQALVLLADIFLEQGRMDHALRSALGAIQMQNKLCIPSDAMIRALAYEAVSRAYMGQREWKQALQSMKKLDEIMLADRATWESRFKYSRDRGLILLKNGKAQDAITIFDIVDRQITDRLGEGHYETLEVRAFSAITQVSLGQYDTARKSLDEIFPKLIASFHDIGGSSTTFVARQNRLRDIAETYLRLLLDADLGGDPKVITNVERSFWVADAVGTRAVYQSLAKGAARFAAKDEAAATLIRRAQDLERRSNALRKRLNDALISKEVAKETLNDLRAGIQNAEFALKDLNQQIAVVAPGYASLIDPQPMYPKNIAEILDQDEALIVTFSGAEKLFTWSITKDGKPAANISSRGRSDVSEVVSDLRLALAPDEISQLSDIPEYDVSKANNLYRETLGQVEASWLQKKRLFVVADGPLGAIPFGLLTRDAKPLEEDVSLLFDRYRNTPFLIRSHEITHLPSASSLIVLRKAAKYSAAEKPFLGFGDPVFDRRNAASRTEVASLRGVVNDSDEVITRRRNTVQTRAASTATIRDLPRLIDTAAELLAIAEVVGADREQDIYLGLDASEQIVQSLNQSGALKNYRTISFATHGLLSGDLNGLFQPALALSEPSFEEKQAGLDGLLTPDEIMLLKLDADWAILSACNTGVGDGAGAEAVSGLGQAFFFAGARAILVSSWPVHSISTRELMSKTFENYSKTGNKGRARALQGAILDMIDNSALVNSSGQKVFSYAHPIFWAPFIVVGDGN